MPEVAVMFCGSIDQLAVQADIGHGQLIQDIATFDQVNSRLNCVVQKDLPDPGHVFCVPAHNCLAKIDIFEFYGFHLVYPHPLSSVSGRLVVSLSGYYEAAVAAYLAPTPKHF